MPDEDLHNDDLDDMDVDTENDDEDDPDFREVPNEPDDTEEALDRISALQNLVI